MLGSWCLDQTHRVEGGAVGGLGRAECFVRRNCVSVLWHQTVRADIAAEPRSLDS